jgi:hypothetical protein
LSGSERQWLHCICLPTSYKKGQKPQELFNQESETLLWADQACTQRCRYHHRAWLTEADTHQMEASATYSLGPIQAWYKVLMKSVKAVEIEPELTRDNKVQGRSSLVLACLSICKASCLCALKNCGYNWLYCCTIHLPYPALSLAGELK